MWVKPELSSHENIEIRRFVRSSPRAVTAKISATLQSMSGKAVAVGVTCLSDKSDKDEIKSIEFEQSPHQLAGEGPLVIGYGAARHVGHGNLATLEGADPTSSLFSDAFDLCDAEEILERMHYASLSGKAKKRDSKRLDALKAAVADLMPDTSVADIEVRGPDVPGRSAAESGIHVRTPSGRVPLSELSLGCQTVFAWTVDLAWRLFRAYPKSARPLHEGAIVLILLCHKHWLKAGRVETAWQHGHR